MQIPKDMRGYCGVGNVYKRNDHQPLTWRSDEFALTFDGYIINEDELRKELGRDLITSHHAEITGRLICRGNDYLDGIKKLADKIKGAYCVGIVSKNGEAYAARCPLGVRPLMLGQGKKGYGVISESRAFRKIAMKPERDFEPGEIVKIDEYGIRTLEKIQGKGRKTCSFMWGYYSWVDSVVDGVPVVTVRQRSIAKLAEKDKKRRLRADIASSIEDSGKAYGEGYGLAFRLPYLTTVPKYPYYFRSYDEETQEDRDDMASGKASTLDANIKGKRIVLCDDSIRRGTVTRNITRYLKNVGAEELHLRIGTPKNIAYCRFDFRDAPDETLIANELKTDKEIAKSLGADSIRFPEVDEFVEAITRDSDLTKDDLCLVCYTRDFSFLD